MCTATRFPASDVTAAERTSEAKTRAQIAWESAPICDLTAIFRNARLIRIGADSDGPLRHGPLSSPSGIAGPKLVNDTKSRTHRQDSCRTDCGTDQRPFATLRRRERKKSQTVS